MKHTKQAVGVKLERLRRKDAVCGARTPLFLLTGLHVLLALLTPEHQFGLHGVDVFLNVVKGLCQKLGAAAHGLDGGADALRFPLHRLPPLLQGNFRLYVLEMERLYTTGENLEMCFKRFVIAVMLKFLIKVLMRRLKNTQPFEHKKSLVSIDET